MSMWEDIKQWVKAHANTYPKAISPKISKILEDQDKRNLLIKKLEEKYYNQYDTSKNH